MERYARLREKYGGLPHSAHLPHHAQKRQGLLDEIEPDTVTHSKSESWVLHRGDKAKPASEKEYPLKLFIKRLARRLRILAKVYFSSISIFIV
jgi:hypothetical protein